MKYLCTAILLFSLVHCVLGSFPQLKDITISKEKHQNKYSCFVMKRDQIKAVVCSHCDVIAAATGYRVITHYLQLLELQFLHDGRVTNVPLRLNCHREEQSPRTTVIQVMSHRKSIAMTLDNKAGIIIVYTDGKSSFSAIQIEPVEDYEINGLHEDTLYQICFSVLNKAGESGNYSCVQTKTKQLTNKGSAVANKNGDPCKNAVTNIEGGVTAHNLVKVKWKIELQGYCQINTLEVRLLEKYSRKCLVLLVLYKRMKISKTVETDNCGNRNRIRVNSLVSGEVLQFWPHSSVRVQGVIQTSHGQLNMNDRDYSSSNLMDTLDNTMETKITKCYDDCYWSYDISKPYRGIRSVNKYGKVCSDWSISTSYTDKTKYTGEGNRCWTLKGASYSTPWCINGEKSYEWCKLPFCTEYTRSYCVEMVNIFSTTHSIHGTFIPISGIRYTFLLFDGATKKCIGMNILSEMFKSTHQNIRDFIDSCRNESVTFIDPQHNNFTFKNLNPWTTYDIYIVPFNKNNIDEKVSYYSQKTLRDKKVNYNFDDNSIIVASVDDWETTCYDDCYNRTKLYRGIRSNNMFGKVCDNWSNSKKYRRFETEYTAVGNRCYMTNDDQAPWCIILKGDWRECNVPLCTDYTRSHCAESVKISSTNNSIHGTFALMSGIRYTFLLFDGATKKCIGMNILSEIFKSTHPNIRDFIDSCRNESLTFIDPQHNNFTFKNLNPNTTYDIYIVPFNKNNIDEKVSYYSQRTKGSDIPLPILLYALVGFAAFSILFVSIYALMWLANQNEFLNSLQNSFFVWILEKLENQIK